jgi:hypothetical protein
MTEIDHATCSELLRPYLEGSLDAARADAVEHHLASCPSCEAEQRALGALLRAPDASLRPGERDRLRNAVLDATGVGTTPSTTAPRRWASRLAPAVGAAALLLVVAVGVRLVGGGAGGGAGGRDAATAGRSSDLRSTEAGGEQTTSGAGPARPGAPRFDSAERALTERDLVELGRTGFSARSAKIARSPSDAEATLGSRLVKELALAAPSAVAPQVRRCARVASGRTGDRPVVPAYGADNLDGLLDRFQIWVWPRGSCDAPLIYQAGRIRD